MGTSSITTVFQDGQPLVTIYRPYDGYPSGHGQDLVDFVGNREIADGGNPGELYDFASEGDMAARLITFHDSTMTYVSLVPHDFAGWNYKYELYRFPNGQVGMRVLDMENELYYGRVKDFSPGVSEILKTISSAVGDEYEVSRLDKEGSGWAFVVKPVE